MGGTAYADERTSGAGVHVIVTLERTTPERGRSAEPANGARAAARSVRVG